MEKRLVAFIIISLLIIFLYPFFISKMTGKAPNTPIPPSQEIAKEAPIAPSLESRELLKDSEEAEAPLVSENQETPDLPGRVSNPDAPEILKIVESDLFRVTLSSHGGVIKKWELKKYTEKNEESGKEEAIELVPVETTQFPLALTLPGESSWVYELDEHPLQLNQGTPKGSVTMRYVAPDGKTVKKELRFSNETYLAELMVSTEGFNQAYDLSLGVNFGIHDWGEQFGITAGSVSLTDNEVLRNIPGKMETESLSYSGSTKWFGLEDKYFISALIPRDESGLGPIVVKKEGEKEILTRIRLEADSGLSTHHFSMYVGPKEYDRLNALKVNLDESIDFGRFIFGSFLPVRMIAKPLFYLLRFFYQFTHNYGIAIILITVLIKAAFFPITQKSMKSMKSMSSIQPKVAAIRKQWAKDKEKMNTELMKLYKTEKVNPLGGCLPIFVQIPVFIALYNILGTTIELRQAPFFLWVVDLSVKDPYYVLPIIMGATMFLQQYTAPKTMDATQAKIMMFLPGVYTFFFLNFPSGLVLYWLVNNTLTILQQYLMNKETGKEALA